MLDQDNPLFCEHANECPHTCPCAAGCYCKTRTCAGRNFVPRPTLTGKVSKVYLHLAADLLGLAADEFSNHGCNDYKLPDWMTRAERLTLSKAMCAESGDPSDKPTDRKHTHDWLLMNFLSREFIRQAGPAPESDAETVRLERIQERVKSSTYDIANAERTIAEGQGRRAAAVQELEDLLRQLKEPR